MDFLRSLLEQARAFWQGLSPGRRIALPVIVLAVLAALVFGTTALNQPRFVPLFTGLSAEDAGAIIAKLKENSIPYRLTDNGAAILVPQEQVYETRLNMASQGLPKGGVVGFEVFNDTKLGTTDFERKLKYNVALQGELTRTIREMSEVEDARVHIVIPERSLFVTEDRAPTASVLLRLRPGRRISDGQIYGIANLLAGSVEGLKPENVTILDSSGNILSDVLANTSLGSGTSGRGLMAQLQIKQEIEKELQREIQSMLEPIFGFGKVVARVTAELNFDYREQNSENYTPVNAEAGTGIIRSRQNSTENYQGSGGGGVPGVSSNIPGYQASANGNSQYQKNATTENYEINRMQEKVIVAPGQIKRLSVAVWVDGKLSQTQLASVRQAVASAAGFSDQRGDQLFVDSMKFENQDLGSEGAPKKPASGVPIWVWAAVGATLALGAGVIVVWFRRRKEAEEVEARKSEALDLLIAEKRLELQQAQIQRAEMSRTEMPRTEIPRTEIPQAEIPRVEIPRVEIRSEEVQQVWLPQEEVIEEEVPQLEVPQPEVLPLEVQPLDAKPAPSVEEQERVIKERQVRNYADEKPEDFAGLIRVWLGEDER